MSAFSALSALRQKRTLRHRTASTPEDLLGVSSRQRLRGPHGQRVVDLTRFHDTMDA